MIGDREVGLFALRIEPGNLGTLACSFRSVYNSFPHPPLENNYFRAVDHNRYTSLGKWYEPIVRIKNLVSFDMHPSTILLEIRVREIEGRAQTILLKWVRLEA